MGIGWRQRDRRYLGETTLAPEPIISGSRICSSRL
jgi:hypothetical protein